MESIVRIFQPPQQKSYFIFGPRGTGKSTWVKNKYPNAVIIDLLADRALLTHIHLFMAVELGSQFSLTIALQFGMLPLI